MSTAIPTVSWVEFCASFGCVVCFFFSCLISCSIVVFRTSTSALSRCVFLASCRRVRTSCDGLFNPPTKSRSQKQNKKARRNPKRPPPPLLPSLSGRRKTPLSGGRQECLWIGRDSTCGRWPSRASASSSPSTLSCGERVIFSSFSPHFLCSPSSGNVQREGSTTKATMMNDEIAEQNPHRLHGEQKKAWNVPCQKQEKWNIRKMDVPSLFSWPCHPLHPPGRRAAMYCGDELMW